MTILDIEAANFFYQITNWFCYEYFELKQSLKQRLLSQCELWLKNWILKMKNQTWACNKKVSLIDLFIQLLYPAWG